MDTCPSFNGIGVWYQLSNSQSCGVGVAGCVTWNLRNRWCTEVWLLIFVAILQLRRDSLELSCNLLLC